MLCYSQKQLPHESDGIKKFLEFMTNEENQKTWIKLNYLPVKQDPELEKQIAENKLLSNIRNIIIIQQRRLPPIKIEYIFKALRPELEDLMMGRISSYTASENAQNNLNDSIKLPVKEKITDKIVPNRCNLISLIRKTTRFCFFKKIII